jgi:hypothetical protein
MTTVRGFTAVVSLDPDRSMQTRGARIVTTSPAEDSGSFQGHRFMSTKRASIAQVMMIVALAAVNLAIAHATPWEIVTYPSLWVVMGLLDFLVVWKLILRRSFRAFHYTFQIVFVIAFFVMANLVATERLSPLGLLVRWYQHLSAEKTNSISLLGFVRIGEFWAVGFISFALAWAVGWVAAWLERRRDWDIAAFWRGALIGFLIAGLLATIDDMASGGLPLETYSIRWTGRMVLLGAGMILGGWMGLSWLKSSRTEPEGPIR